MSDAPERIWAIRVNPGHPRESIYAQVSNTLLGGIGYVRADLFDAMTAERDAALALVAEAYESAANVALHGKQARRESIAFDIAELTPADALAAQAARDERMRAEGAKAAGINDYFGSLVGRARTAAAKAAIKFPQPNYVTLKIAEEAGEVVRGAVHFAENRMDWSEVEGEIVQLLAMLIRFVTEGDLVNGVIPPRAALKEDGDE